jgi:hypothetical protein
MEVAFSLIVRVFLHPDIPNELIDMVADFPLLVNLANVQVEAPLTIRVTCEGEYRKN